MMTPTRRQEKEPRAVIGLLLLCLFTSRIASAGEIVLSSAGKGQWQVSATGLANVHALDLDLRYDPLRLSALTVTAGAALTGAMSAINDKVPGTIRLGVASTQPLAQNGILLNLQSAAPAAELIVSRFAVNTVDANGKIVATTVRQQLPAQSPLTETLADIPAEKTPEQITSSPITIARSRHTGTFGGLFPPREEEATPPPLPQEREKLSPPAATVTTSATTSEAARIPAFSGQEKRFHSQEEIVTAIERLPQPWTVAAIKAIFLKPATSSQVHQEPPVALADGKSRVRLYLPRIFSQKKPSIAVQGCLLDNIQDAGEEGWEIELTTRTGIWPAKALLLGEGDLIQFPVVIVPNLTITRPTGENTAIPAADYSGDGSITALDAYLYVGNLLARQELAPRQDR